MRKKIFAAGLLCGMLLTGITQTGTAYAASPSLSASADTKSVAEGDYVNVDVKIDNNPAISTLGASLNYDSSVLKYDSSTWNSEFSGSDMQMASDTGSEVNLSVVCEDSYTADGTVVTVRFQAVKDSSSVPVTLALRDMADAELTEISDYTVAGAVGAPEENKPSDENSTSGSKDPKQQTNKKTDENSTVDLQDPEEASGIDIVDEQSGAEEDPQPASSDTDGGMENLFNAGSTENADAGMTKNVSNVDTDTRAAAAPEDPVSRLDLNYKTGAGLGSDVLLIAAAGFGILALVLAVRRHKEEDQ